MPFLDQSIDDQTIRELDLRGLLDDILDDEKAWSFIAILSDRANSFGADENHPQAAALRVIATALSFYLSPNHCGFEQTIAPIESLGEHDLALLSLLARGAPHPWLKARFADLAVTLSNQEPADWKLGRIAAESYLDYVLSVFGTESAIRGLDDVQRGLVLARVYAKNDDSLRARYWDAILSEITHSIRNDWPGIVFALANEAIHRNPNACFGIAEQIEDNANTIRASRPLDASSWFEMAFKLYRRGKHTDEYLRCLNAQGYSLIEAADLESTRNPLAAPEHMALGISVLRRAKAQGQIIRELRDRLSTYERAALDHFTTIEVPTNVKDWAQWVESQVSADDLLGSLLQMAYRVGSLLSKREIEARILDAHAKNPLSRSIPRKIVDHDGVTVLTRAPLDSDDPRSVASHAIAEVCAIDIPMRSSVAIEVARIRVTDRHFPSFNQVRELVFCSSSIPRDKAETIARGLFAGFYCDWISTAVYLIPLVETVVRDRLNRFGVHTKSLDEDGSQAEKTLGDLLDMPESKTFIGENMTFELRALLTDKDGMNLRNAYCHGLVADAALHNVGVVTLWWLMWRIVLLPWAGIQTAKMPPENPTF